ncbi:MurNAc alpha-1-phosphate uridylyltransferase [Shimia abyssi]|uniref:MurNAc alpha-1-phosphate uridylyltransferase n=2 Tax=Shimia abyssi TaxID=1662395 RepID=A0A2P8F8E7_9RHOB|nr:MurNAc alpha-1-phosphate uridylyltransferase [Shimia abyssi]
MMFAAGFGRRMGNLTKDTPKPLIRVAGVPLIDHTLCLVREINSDHIVANVHYLPDALVNHFRGSEVALSHESPDILETGGGLKHALPLLGKGPVFTTNTDAIWQGPNPFMLALSHWAPSTMDALTVCIPTENAIGHSGQGDFRLSSQGKVSRGPGVVYGGVQILKTDGLFGIQEASFSLNRLWDNMIANGTLYGVIYPGKWCDVGSAEGIALAENLLRDTHV